MDLTGIEFVWGKPFDSSLEGEVIRYTGMAERTVQSHHEIYKIMEPTYLVTVIKDSDDISPIRYFQEEVIKFFRDGFWIVKKPIQPTKGTGQFKFNFV